MESTLKWMMMILLAFLAAGNLDIYIDGKMKRNPSRFWTWIYLFIFFICIIPAVGYMFA